MIFNFQVVFILRLLICGWLISMSTAVIKQQDFVKLVREEQGS